MIITTQEALEDFVESLEDVIEIEEEGGAESSKKLLLKNTANFIAFVEPDNSNNIHPTTEGFILEQYATFRWHLIDGAAPDGYKTIGPLIEAIRGNASIISIDEILLLDPDEGETLDPTDLGKINTATGGDSAYIIADDVAEDRLYFEEDFSPEEEASVSTDDYYTTAGIWSARQFDGEEFDLNNVIAAGFKTPVRPLKYSSDDVPRREASLYVVGLNGVVWFGTSNFILEAVQKIEQEVPITISSMAGSSISFACSPNSTYRFQGRLFDASNYDWARNWEYNWQAYMKGKVTARNNCRIVLLYNNQMISGYMVNFQSASQVGLQLMESMMFDVFVSNYEIIPPVINVEGEEYISDTLTLSERVE